ncbi:MAG: RNase adapter RapZ [Rhodospirillales bacterium]|nr:RNase adapter RapZ [Rhodospirillales bacterium]
MPDSLVLKERKRLIVTGKSGSGLSSALKSLEDIGYDVIDNLPLSLLDSLLDQPDIRDRALAVGLDVRSLGFDPAAILAQAERRGLFLLFLTCDDAALQKRFTATRRRHPLARDKSVADGIRAERMMLDPLRRAADLVVDTTALSIHDLRHILEGHFGLESSGRLAVTVLSFSFGQGMPREADLVFDVRFLRNPHWDETLRSLSGLDAAVGTYIGDDPACGPFLDALKGMVGPLLPRYAQEGKSYLTLAFGCTGGRHRSVWMAEEVGRWLESLGCRLSVRHRDLQAGVLVSS